MKFLEIIGSFPEYVLLKDQKRVLSNLDFLRLIEEKSRALTSCAGKVCQLEMSQGIDSIITFFSLAKAGCIVAPTFSVQNEIGPFVNYNYDYQSEALIKTASNFQSPFINELKRLGHAGLVLSSSGSSGKPKVVLHNFNRLSEKYLKLQTAIKTVLVFPLNHVSGIETLLSVLSAGGSVHLPKSNQIADVLSCVEQNEIQFISCTPSYLKLLLLQPNWQCLQKLDFINLGGERTRSADLAFFKESLGHVEFRQAFGSTETTNFRTYETNGDWIKIGEKHKDYRVQDGILFLKSPFSMIANLSENTSAQEWHCTHDLVEELGNDRLRFLTRQSEIISVGGEKVIPTEVEEVLLNHPAIQDAIVYGEDNQLLGQIIVAKIVMAQTISKEALRQHCRKFLPEHKVPFRIIFTSELDISQRLKRSH